MSVKKTIAIDEAVHAAGDADAALGLGAAQAGFEQVRIGGVQLQAHHAGTPVAPPSGRRQPAKVVHAHAFAAVAENAELIARALGSKIRVLQRVIENTRRRLEMLE